MSRIAPLLLATAALAPAAPAQQGLAETLPDSTLFYLEIPDVQAFADGFAGSSLGRIWADDALQEFLAPVLPMIDGALMQARSGLEAQGIPGALLDPATYGRVELGLAMSGFDPVTGPNASFGARLTFHDPAVAQSLFQLIGGYGAAMGAEVSDDLVRIQDEDSLIAVRLTGSTLAVDGGKGEVAGGPLAAAPGFQEARQALPDGQMFLHLDLGRFVDLGLAALNQFAPEEARAMVPMVLGGIGLDSLATLSVTTGWRGGDSFGEGVMTFRQGGPTGLIGAGLHGAHADKSLAEYIPADATSFSIGAADLSAVWNFITTTADQLIDLAESQGQAIDRGMPELAWLYGEDRAMYDQAFAAIGPETFSWQKAEFSMMGGGGSGGSFVRVRDVEAVRKMLAGVMPQLAAILADVDFLDLQIKDATDRKKNADGEWTTVKLGEYYQFRFNLNALPMPDEAKMQMGMMANMLPKPAFGVTDDGWLVFSLQGSPAVRKAMKAGVQKPAENILANEEAADFLGRVPDDASGIRWSDPRPVVAGAVTMIQGMLPMVTAQMGDQFPLDLEKMPGPDVFTSHLRTSEALSWFDGDKARMTSVGSFNGGEAMVLVGLGLATFAGVTALVEEEQATELEIESAPTEPEVIADEGDPMEATRMELLRLDTGLMLYNAVNSAYPDSLEVLLQPQPDWDEGFLADPEAGIQPDGWGNPFVYKLTAAGYQLYSCGPNGVDDGGNGDDVKLQ